MGNQASCFTGEKPGDFKSCFTLHMSMELFWVLILSELFPEDRKIQDSLRISSCVNGSVDLSLLGISLMCFYSCFYSWWAVGLQFSQLALLVLFPLITFASSIQIWSSQRQGLCHLCITPCSKGEGLGGQILLSLPGLRFHLTSTCWDSVCPCSLSAEKGGEKKDKKIKLSFVSSFPF